jgi:predicted Zn finger-like uncharacterized protein
MKFLCPSCKAKYQIADEKVAGRSVRMKCRKCGFMIQVSSASAAPPSLLDSEPPDQLSEAASSAPPPPEPEVAAKPAPSPAAPRVAPAPAPVPKPTISSAKAAPVPAPRPPPGKAASTVPKPAGPPARPSAPRAAPAPSAPKPAAPVAAPVRAPTPAPAPVAVPSPTFAKAADVPRDFESDDEVTRMADAGALAGAFSQAFGGGVEVPASEPAPLSMPGDEWFVGINGVPVGPIRLSELRSKAASGAVNKESLVWRDGFEDWRPLKTYPELLAIVEEGVSSARASLTPFTPPASEARDMTAKPALVTAATDPFVAPLSGAVTGSAVVTDDISALIPPRRGTSPMVWVAMVIAIGLGLTIGFVLFGGQKPQETKIVEKIVEVEKKGADNTGSPAAANGVPETAVAGDPQATKKPGTGAGKAPATPEGDVAKQNTGLKGLTGLSGLGPSGGPAGTGGPSGATGGGQPLDGGQIQSTVARYTGSVKRRCWQPALDARAKDAPMTAKVTVTMNIGPTGTVQSATTQGDPKGYPGLGNCISSSVRSWQFPASGGTTQANVPFVFAGQ